MRKMMAAFIIVLTMILSMTALAETPCPVDFLGCELLVPDGWEIDKAADNPTPSEDPSSRDVDYNFSYKKEGAEIFSASLALVDSENTDARIRIALNDPVKFAEEVRTNAKNTGFTRIDTVTPFSFWTQGRPILGAVAFGVKDDQPQSFMTCMLPTVSDTVAYVFYRAPFDGSLDMAWFLGALEAQFPEVAGLGLLPKADAAAISVEAPQPTATPKPDVATFKPEEVVALNPRDLGLFVAESPETVYLKLTEVYGLPLAPFMAWAKTYGLAELKVAKDGTLSLTVAKEFREAWGGLKEVSAPVPADEWLDKKGLQISMTGLHAVMATLAEAWTQPETLPENALATLNPQTLGAQFAQNPEAAYLQVAEVYGLSLTPLTQWAKAQGLDEPKAAKDGALSFPIAAKRRQEWGGLKKIDVPIPTDDWLDQKGLRVSGAGLRLVVAVLANTWTEPQPDGAGAPEAVQLTTPLMTEEQIKEKFPNYAWEYIETNVTPAGDGREATDDMNKNIVRQGEGLYYSEWGDMRDNSFHAIYIPFDKEFYYNIYSEPKAKGDRTGSISTLTEEMRESYASSHDLASSPVGYARDLDMTQVTVVERGAMVAGRPTTRYAGFSRSEYVNLWVDDEYGIVLKGVSVYPQYGYLSTIETTSLTFGEVTEENICDVSELVITDNEYEEERDTTTPRGRDLMISAAELHQKYPNFHVEYLTVSPNYSESGDTSGYWFVERSNHLSQEGLYELDISFADASTGYGRYWQRGQDSYYYLWPNSQPEANPVDEGFLENIEYFRLPSYSDYLTEYRLFLEEEGVLVAGRSTKRYSGSAGGQPFQVWIDDELRMVLKYESLQIDGTTPEEMMEITSLTLEDTGLPSLEEVHAQLDGYQSGPEIEKIVEYIRGLGFDLAATSESGSSEGTSEHQGEAWTEDSPWTGVLLLAPDVADGDIQIVRFWTQSPVGDLVIPNEVEERAVIGIGEMALTQCHGLTSVTIPEGVTSIGADAFSSCYDLVSVAIPGSMTEILEGAFRFCDRLTEVAIPDSVTKLGDMAFAGCESLTEITIPASMTIIEGNPFLGCFFTAIEVSPDNPAYTQIEGVLFDKQLETLIAYPGGREGAYSIPKGTRVIGNMAFAWNKNLTAVTIPDGVTSIGDRAFVDCASLASVTIPESVTSISDYAFAVCAELTNVIVPQSVTSIGAEIFYECSKVILSVKAGSMAEQYAKDNGIAYELIR